VLQSQLTRLDLVSREEFDVQTQVLLRTRETGAAGAASERSGNRAAAPERRRQQKQRALRPVVVSVF
jgi:BMFP domain-containing protein YqiC